MEPKIYLFKTCVLVRCNCTKFWLFIYFSLEILLFTVCILVGTFIQNVQYIYILFQTIWLHTYFFATDCFSLSCEIRKEFSHFLDVLLRQTFFFTIFHQPTCESYHLTVLFIHNYRNLWSVPFCRCSRSLLYGHHIMTWCGTALGHLRLREWH